VAGAILSPAQEPDTSARASVYGQPLTNSPLSLPLHSPLRLAADELLINSHPQSGYEDGHPGNLYTLSAHLQPATIDSCGIATGCAGTAWSVVKCPPWLAVARRGRIRWRFRAEWHCIGLRDAFETERRW